MDNEKQLTKQETAPKPKKQTKKKNTTQQTTQELDTTQVNTVTQQDAPEQTTSTTETEQQTTNAPDTSASSNWDFFNNTQNVQTKSSKGGSNHTSPVKRNAQKRIRKAKTQKASRRINRKK